MRDRRYTDILAEALDLARSGGNVEGLIARHPEHAERLRQDLATAAAARDAAAGQPAPSTARLQRLQADLAAERERRSAPRGRFGGVLPRLAIASAAAVALVAAVLYFAPQSQQTAEASVEGVIVEQQDGFLTLQTAGGLQQIELRELASVTDATGVALDPDELEPGQVLSVEGVRRAGVIRARRADVRPAEELRPWCGRHEEACRAAESRIAGALRACSAGATACRNASQRLEQLRELLTSVERLRELNDRCANGEGCSELRRFCAEHAGVCELLREPAPQRQTPGGRPPR